MTSFDLRQFISYKNLVTWSHVTTCDYLVTSSHMESQVVTLVTVVDNNINNVGMALMVITALCNLVTAVTPGHKWSHLPLLRSRITMIPLSHASLDSNSHYFKKFPESRKTGSLTCLASPQVKTRNMGLDSKFHEFFELSPAKCHFLGLKMELFNSFIIGNHSNRRGSLISGVIHVIYERKLVKQQRLTLLLLSRVDKVSLLTMLIVYVTSL